MLGFSALAFNEVCERHIVPRLSRAAKTKATGPFLRRAASKKKLVFLTDTKGTWRQPSASLFPPHRTHRISEEKEHGQDVKESSPLPPRPP